MKKLWCLLFGHNFGEPTNIRILHPFLLMMLSSFPKCCDGIDVPRFCDRKCKRCGKVKTESHVN